MNGKWEKESGLILSYKVLYIRLSEQSFRPRTNSARKYGTGPLKEENLSQRGCLFSRGRVQPLCPTGLSLPPTSAKNAQTACSSSGQGGFYRQVTDSLDLPRATDSPKASPTDQRFGQRSIGGLADKKQSPWLSPKANELSVLNSNASMIVTLGRSWRKFTALWSTVRLSLCQENRCRRSLLRGDRVRSRSG